MPDDEAQRVAWFDAYVKALDAGLMQPAGNGPYRCPCCHKHTLGERGAFEICDVCGWEDDGQDDRDADVVRGGPNGALSLTEARANYVRCGACEPAAMAYVRSPRPDEL